MESIILSLIFKICITFGVLIALRSYLLKYELKKYFIFGIGLFCVIWIIYTISVFEDIKEYNSFNSVKLNEINKILINDKTATEKNKKALYNQLKIDYLTLLNHPHVVKSDTIKVYTNSRIYKFIIEDTSNQGVLVSRINKEGNIYMINRNDILLTLIENNN
jgi:uncharacterized membrane protein (DUF485 family)